MSKSPVFQLLLISAIYMFIKENVGNHMVFPSLFCERGEWPVIILFPVWYHGVKQTALI